MPNGFSRHLQPLTWRMTDVVECPDAFEAIEYCFEEGWTDGLLRAAQSLSIIEAIAIGAEHP